MNSDSLFALHREWEVLPLGEACRLGGGNVQTGPFGSQLHAADYVPEGIPSVMPQNIGDNKILASGIARITHADAERLSRYRLQEGDIVYSRRGNVERRALVRSNEDGWLCGTGCLRIRFGDGIVYPKYAAHYLGHPSVREWVVRHAHGATMPNLNTTILSELPFVLPPWNIQTWIGDVIEAYDKRIDINCRINQTLETMAQAIFKSWFVDFDPVKAKLAAIREGRDSLRAAMSAISGKSDTQLETLSSEQYEQLAATAVLFPDEMVESAWGEIPRGWGRQRVGNVLELAYGKALKSTERKSGTVPVYGSGGITGYHNTPLIQHGSIIVGRKGTVGSLYWEDEPFFPIDTTYFVRPVAAPLTFCYYALQTLGLEKMNTDAAVPGLNRENVYRLEVLLPDSVTLQKFDQLVLALRKAIRANVDSNKALANLRDTLLPKLLSGELSTEALSKPVGAT
ncbi:restriction endonuclease subunit S [Pseudoduganella sp. R-32]|uniref:restriction endonuclease subunit S n=1 Tax=Pseudoduganella sp. R-32 TaxID=3404061 RepID=UPI003CF60E8B